MVVCARARVLECVRARRGRGGGGGGCERARACSYLGSVILNAMRITPWTHSSSFMDATSETALKNTKTKTKTKPPTNKHKTKTRRDSDNERTRRDVQCKLAVCYSLQGTSLQNPPPPPPQYFCLPLIWIFIRIGFNDCYHIYHRQTHAQNGDVMADMVFFLFQQYGHFCGR